MGTMKRCAILLTIALLLSACAAPTLADCPITPFAPTPDPPVGAFSPHWYGQGDLRLAMGRSTAGWWAIGEHSVLWWRRSGTFDEAVRIRGQRIDGRAPALSASSELAPGADLQPGTLTLPQTGCWRIEAVSGDLSLEIVAWVIDERP